jgi:hypothetical protein
MALIALFLGLGLERLMPDDAPARSQGLLGYVLIVLMFPALVYGTFVVFGGPQAAFDGKTAMPDDNEFDD